jgi:hypothetical protein
MVKRKREAEITLPEIYREHFDRMLEEELQKFFNELAKDFNVPSPKVEVLPLRILGRKAEGVVAAFYEGIPQKIVVSYSAFYSGGILLHEFCHHLQLLRAGGDPYKAFPPEELKMPYCERPTEKEAKEFEEKYLLKYNNKILKIRDEYFDKEYFLYEEELRYNRRPYKAKRYIMFLKPKHEKIIEKMKEERLRRK